MRKRQNTYFHFLLQRALPSAVCALALFMVAETATAAETADEAPNQEAVIRVLAPPGIEMEGRTEIETLLIDPEIRRVVFFVDGEEVAQRKAPPWNAKIALDKPAREQTVEVRAYGKGDQEMGRDQVLINRRHRPFRVQITALGADPTSGVLNVEADVAVPHGATFDQLDFYFNQTHVHQLKDPPFAARLKVSPTGSGDFLRAVAVLEDGRSHEDVELLDSPGLSDEVDVNLVQVQVLVSHKNGAPVTDLELDNFELTQGGKRRKIESFRLAGDVPLNLGLVLDSSGSMRGTWTQTLDTAKRFLHQIIQPYDRAFLVDFNEKLSLVQGLTTDPFEIFAALDTLTPEGGTALYDSILYSLLQFESEPGRRALVVLTDGLDSASNADERHAVEYGRKLGVPIYVIALPGSGTTRPQTSIEVHTLKLVTDPTGGRLLRVGARGGLDRAFSQIGAELRHQYVLTFYTETLPDDKGQKVSVKILGRKGVEARAVFAWDQMS